MATRDRAPLGAPTWIDLLTSDLERAQEFYGTVFGWTFESAGAEYGGYVTASKDGHPVAGLMGNNPEFRAPDGWTTYLHSADVDATLAAATAAGDKRKVGQPAFLASAAAPLPSSRQLVVFGTMPW